MSQTTAEVLSRLGYATLAAAVVLGVLWLVGLSEIAGWAASAVLGVLAVWIITQAARADADRANRGAKFRQRPHARAEGRSAGAGEPVEPRP